MSTARWLEVINTATRQMEGYVIPHDEEQEIIGQMVGIPAPGAQIGVVKGGASYLEAEIRKRCVVRFEEVLNKVMGDDLRATFLYFHDGSGPSHSPMFINGEHELDDSVRDEKYQFAPLDTVFVILRTFRDRPSDLTRVLNRITWTGALIYLDQSGITDPMPIEEVTQLFHQNNPQYVPVMEGMLDGLFRPLL